MAYGDFKDLTGKIASDKILYDKAFNIAKNPNFNGLYIIWQKVFDKKI